jgi:hypothetical protein
MRRLRILRRSGMKSNVDGGGSPGVAGAGGGAGVAAPVAEKEAAPETDAWGVGAPDMTRDDDDGVVVVLDALCTRAEEAAGVT